jgi:hypothetical protein
MGLARKAYVKSAIDAMQVAASPTAPHSDDNSAMEEQLTAAAARIAELEAALLAAQQQQTGNGTGTADGPASLPADGAAADAGEIQRLR